MRSIIGMRASYCIVAVAFLAVLSLLECQLTTSGGYLSLRKGEGPVKWVSKKRKVKHSLVRCQRT